MLDVLAEAELHAKVLRHFRQARGEHLAVARLVIRQSQGSGQNVGDAGQCRFNPGNPGTVEQLERNAGLLEYRDVLGCTIQLRLCAEQLGGAEVTGFISNAGFGAQFVEAVTAVLGQTYHALLVDGIAAGGTVAQHLRHPQVLIDIGGGLDRQRGVAFQQPFDGFERNAWRCPRRSIAWGHLAGVGKTGFHCNGWLTVHNDNVETGSGQIIGAGSTNNAATQYHNSHIYFPHRGQPQTFIVQSEDGRSIRSIGQ